MRYLQPTREEHYSDTICSSGAALKQIIQELDFNVWHCVTVWILRQSYTRNVSDRHARFWLPSLNGTRIEWRLIQCASRNSIPGELLHVYEYLCCCFFSHLNVCSLQEMPVAWSCSAMESCSKLYWTHPPSITIHQFKSRKWFRYWLSFMKFGSVVSGMRPCLWHHIRCSMFHCSVFS